MRLNNTKPDNTEQNPITPDAAETMDLAVGCVQDADSTYLHHNASYATLNSNKRLDIIPNRKAQIKPIPQFTERQRLRFWSLVDKRDPAECWPWMGAQGYANPKRTIFYGIFCQLKAHRVAYHLSVGPIPEGKTIDHVKARGCTSTLCCNPSHLEPVSMSEQVIRRDASKVVAPGFSECKWGHIRPIGRKAHCNGCNNLNVAWHIRKNQSKHSAGRIAWADQQLADCPAFVESKKLPAGVSQ